MPKYLGRKYYKDTWIAFSILTLPFTIYFHLLYSNDLTAISIFGYLFFHGFTDNETFVWTILKSLIPFLLGLIWYSTNRRFWRYLLLPLLCILIFPILNDISRILFFQFSDTLVIVFLDIFFVTVFTLLFDFVVIRGFTKHAISVSLKDLRALELRTSYRRLRRHVKLLLNSEKNGYPSSHLLSVIHLNQILFRWGNIYLNRNVINISKEGKWKKNSVIIFVLLISCYMSIIHCYVPLNIKSLDFGFFVIETYGFKSVETFVWFVFYKLLVLVPMTLWYFTCEHWWKYAILSPIILYSYQFWEIFQDQKFLEAYGNVKIFPAIFIIVLIVFMFSKVVKYKTEISQMHETLSEEIDNLLVKITYSQEPLKEAIEHYQNVKRNKNRKEDRLEERLEELISLKEELLNKLKTKKPG